MALVAPAVERAGGRFVSTMVAPPLHRAELDRPGPSEINIVEWDTAQGLDELQTSETFLQHHEKLHSGTTRFELVRVAPIDPEA